jgi:hypothetical protein
MPEVTYATVRNCVSFPFKAVKLNAPDPSPTPVWRGPRGLVRGRIAATRASIFSSLKLQSHPLR